MAVINVLDKHVAELIAAGEVVERPASVVKELCENAIDAKATVISVSIEHGGVSLISIQDNGSGIDAEYVATAFLRHATSKVKTQNDLEDIHTLGFRGEALASIASVSHIELLTRTESDEYACLYRISGGEEEGLCASARPIGTTITVKDLFYNTPARMKFLKKDVSEGNLVADIVGHLALSHPEISFKLMREGKLQFHTPGDGELRSAAYEVLTRDFARELIELDYKEGNYAVSGLVTPPRAARASRAMQYFFVNGRFVKNRTMMAALEAAYAGTLMQGKYPGCIMSLQMPPELVDVNVHPAKTEVRFAREGEVFDIVYKAVKSGIISVSGTNKELEINEKQPVATPVKQTSITPDFSQIHIITLPKVSDSINNEESLCSSASVQYNINEEPKQDNKSNIPYNETKSEATINQTDFIAAYKNDVSLRVVGEIFSTYIVTERGNEMCLIDKHAAHERMIYEELMLNYGEVASQMLLAPVTATLSAEEKNALMQNEMILAKSGIEIEDFGGMSVLVRAVPTDVVPDSVESLIVELAHSLLTGNKNTMAEKTQWVLHSIACRAAIKAGDKSRETELLRLAQEVLDGEIPPFCPHGRPIVLRLTRKELEKQFGRQ